MHRVSRLAVVLATLGALGAASVPASVPASAGPPPPTTTPPTTPSTTAPTTTAPTTTAPPSPTAAPTTTAPVAPAATGDVIARPASNGRAVVNWPPVSGLDRYVVETYEGTVLVANQRAAANETVVAGLTPGSSYYVVVTPEVGGAGGGVSNTIVALGAVAPDPVTGLTASVAAANNRAVVRWTPPAAGPAPDYYSIGVWENGVQTGSLLCFAPCTERTATLTPGVGAGFVVQAANDVGLSMWTVSNVIWVPRPCPLACLTVDATTTDGPARRRAAGFLHAIGPVTDSARVSALRPEQWRVSWSWYAGNEASMVAGTQGATLTELLSGSWSAFTNAGQGAALPWADWTLYSNFITFAVTAFRAVGIPVTYWEIENEPGGTGYYPPGVVPTVEQLLTQYKVAYDAIKAVEPGAKVVAPSLIGWVDDPDALPGQLDMRTFLDFAVLNDMQFDAISFHNNHYERRVDEYSKDGWGMQPDEVERSIDRLRQLVAERPSLGDPAILVNEYGDPWTIRLPGWDVGRIAALESADVDEANRTCWWGTCVDGHLNGLLAGDGHTTMPAYWVYAFYAAADGERVPVTTTFSDVTGFAAVDEAGTVRVLVGRHQGCAPALQPEVCTFQPAVSAANVPVTIRVPFDGEARITMASIPASAGPLAQPVNQTTQTVTPDGNGKATITLPQVGDGDAWQITVRPA